MQAEPVGDDAQDLDPADAKRDEHRNQRDVEVVVELADRLHVRPAVGAEHQDAVGRVHERHAGREQRRQDQDVLHGDVVGT